MKEYLKLDIESRPLRSEIKPSALRRQNKLPGIIYGKGIDSIPFQVEERAWKKFYYNRNNIFNVSVDGKKEILVTLKEYSIEPGTERIEHLSFQKLTKGQETSVTIPIRVIGEPLGPLTLVFKEIEIKGIPSKMPKVIEVDVSSLEPGSYVTVKEINIPAGLSPMAEPDQIIVSCQKRQLVEEEPPKEAEATEAPEPPPAS